MANIEYFFAAYTVIWIGFFGYLLFLNRKQSKLRKALELLKKTMGEKE
ncbi:CcmD family protein [Chloroflexota bacterium]